MDALESLPVSVRDSHGDDGFDDRFLYQNRWALCADLAHIQGSKQNTRVDRQIGRGWKGAQLEMVRGKGMAQSLYFVSPTKEPLQSM